jgi:hypothetical protein
MQAQSMVQEQIDGQITVLWSCVKEFRRRVNDPKKEVLVDVAIDQQGLLTGVTTATPQKGTLDAALARCLYAALHALPFPRSQGGIISVRESFADPAGAVQ